MTNRIPYFVAILGSGDEKTALHVQYKLLIAEVANPNLHSVMKRVLASVLRRASVAKPLRVSAPAKSLRVNTLSKFLRISLD
jgi:hypothetical protein